VFLWIRGHQKPSSEHHQTTSDNDAIDVDKELEPVTFDLLDNLRYEDSDNDDEDDKLNSIVMINKDGVLEDSKMKRLWGKGVRIVPTDSKVSGSQHGVRLPDSDCLQVTNRWRYGDVAMIHKKHAPAFSKYEEVYFPALVIGSYKGKLAVIGKCSDDVGIMYTGEVMAIPVYHAIHPLNYCVGVASDFTFFGNPNLAPFSVACRAIALKPLFEAQAGDMCVCPAKQGQPLSVLQLVSFVKINEWKAVFVVLPSSEISTWPWGTLQARLGTVGAALFLEKFRSDQNAYVWIPEQRIPKDVRSHSDKILKTAIECLVGMSLGEVESIKSVVHMVSVLRKQPTTTSWNELEIITE
jgi:hypothetical protein